VNGWGYLVTPRAERDLRRLAPADRGRVFDALDDLTDSPDRGDVRKLQGHVAEWRLRVGAIRVRFRRDSAAGLIVVLRVLPRGRAYRD